MNNNPTVLIGLDGATFTLLDPLMDEGVMPFLKRFIESGVRGILPSVVPPLTPPAWTSIMTGRSPGNHGIFDFLRFESSNGRYLTLSNSRHVRCETIWSIVSRHGLSAASLNFSMMAPVRPISGYVIPGWVPWRLMKRCFYPSDLYSRLKEIPGFDLRELAMDVNMDEKAIEGCPEGDYEDWIGLHTRREQRWFDILHYLMKEDPCRLMAVVFDGVDKIQHLCWRFLDPAFFPHNPSSWEKKIRALCLEYFRQLDRYISEIVMTAGPDANIFICSDHGFTATREIFYLNAWLHRHGYLEWAADDSMHTGVSGKLGLDLPRKQAYMLDWRRTTAYAITPSSNAIHICVQGERGEYGIPPKSYEGFRRELMEKLLQFTDPDTGGPVIKKIATREEIFDGDQMHDAPDLTLTLRDNGFVSILRSDALLESRPEPLGTHHPEGIFIGRGPSVQKGCFLDQLSILDIVPTLLYSLGLPVPEDLEGRVPADIFEPCAFKERPVLTGPSTIKPEPFPEKRYEEQHEDQAQILNRLKALGYVE